MHSIQRMKTSKLVLWYLEAFTQSPCRRVIKSSRFICHV